MAKAKWTAGRVIALLEVRYPAPEWAFVAGLRGHVGYRHPGRESYLDAFAMRCYPSKGLTRVSLEVKVSRSDWLAELRDPKKRATGMRLGHEFWFVAPAGVIKKGEVPEGCGWLEAIEGGLRTKLQAPYREVEAMPEEFTASLLRAIVNPERVCPATAKLFRWAGRDLTVKEFAERSAQEIQRRGESIARSIAREELQKTPEYKLGAAVRRAMGIGWRTPTVEDFRLWLESVRLGVPVSARDEASRLVRAAGELGRRAEELQQALGLGSTNGKR